MSSEKLPGLKTTGVSNLTREQFPQNGQVPPIKVGKFVSISACMDLTYFGVLQDSAGPESKD